MNVWKSLSMLAIGGLLSASVAAANGPVSESWLVPLSDMPTQSEAVDLVFVPEPSDDNVIIVTEVIEWPS